jgi:hypothetical protein
MTKGWVRRALVSTTVLLAASLARADAYAQFPDLESDTECSGCWDAVDALGARVLAGTWSSALTSPEVSGWRAEDFFCFVACTPAAWSVAAALLHDPATAHAASLELFPRVIAANAEDAWRLLTVPAPSSAFAGQATRPITCEPHGFATQVLSPLPLRIEQRADGFTLNYEEFGVERIASFGMRAAQRMNRHGVSTARLEHGALVIETTQLPAGRLYDWFGALAYSDRLRVVERYRVSGDGQWLDLDVAFEDPATLREPLRLQKRWRRTPDVELLPYACEAISGVR